MRKQLRKTIALFWTTDSMAGFEMVFPIPTNFWFLLKRCDWQNSKLRSESVLSSKSIGMLSCLGHDEPKLSLIMHIEFNKGRRLFAPFLRIWINHHIWDSLHRRHKPVVYSIIPLKVLAPISRGPSRRDRSSLRVQ